MKQLAEQNNLVESSLILPERQLPSGINKLERITQHTKGLGEDITSWVELKLKLTQIEIEEKVDARVNDLAANAIVAGFALMGAIFGLITLSMGIGAIFVAVGLTPFLSYFLGFLSVTLILFAGAAIVRSKKPHLVKVGTKTTTIEEKKLS